MKGRNLQKVTHSIYNLGFLIDLLICLYSGTHFPGCFVRMGCAQTTVSSVRLLFVFHQEPQRGCVIRANEIYGEIRLNFCISRKSSQKGWWLSSCWPSNKYIKDAICWWSSAVVHIEKRAPSVNLISG